ncbi:MAG: 50S ribosomal protein L10 [Gammaproteobacteria bacterium]|nr:50S ribosomal protein L10 [Gammaproteobacteria bacterium]
MTLRLEDKKAIVAEVNAVANSAISAVVADYRGLTVAEMTELRAKARETRVDLRVVRNTLAKRALQDTNFSCLSEVLTGPLFMAFSLDDPGAAARLLKKFAKEHDRLTVKALSVDGQLLAADQLTAVAELPTRDEALAMLMGVMIAPISKLVRTVAEPHTKLVRTVAAVRDSKQ